MSRAGSNALLRFWRRAIFRWRRAELDGELAEELEFHRLLKDRENTSAGMSPETATELGRKQMGNITLAKEESRDMWSFMRLERFLQDLRYAARMFGRSPAFTAIAVLSLALGIGGNAAMFSLVNTLLVRPLPYRQPERLVRITGIFPRAAVPVFQQRGRAMDVAAVSMGSELNLTGQGEAMRVVGSSVSANFLRVLGASVAQGRAFERGEDLPGRDGVVILSSSLWKDKFGRDPAIIGRVITLNGINRQVAGIMPAGFSYPSSKVQLWIPMRLDPANFLEYWAGEFVPLIGRLRPGATIQEAQGETHLLVTEFRKTFPYPMARDWNADSTAIPLQRDLVGDIRDKLIILLSSGRHRFADRLRECRQPAAVSRDNPPERDRAARGIRGGASADCPAIVDREYAAGADGRRPWHFSRHGSSCYLQVPTAVRDSGFGAGHNRLACGGSRHGVWRSAPVWPSVSLPR